MALPPDVAEYQLAHIQDSRVSGFVTSVSIVACLATIAVTARLTARVVTKVGFGLDDYLIVVSLVMAWGMFAGNIIETHVGLGRHMIASSAQDLIDFGKLLLFEDLAYCTAVFVVQLSFLALYHRVFTFQNKAFRGAVFVVGALSFGCWISIFFATVFSCKPIAYTWDKSIPGGECINPGILFIAGLSLNLFIDICIVLLPVPMIWRIQISRGDKIAVCATFLLGGFACVGNLIRLPYLIGVQQLDLTYSLVGGEIWGTAEVCIGIVSACLPCFRPFIRVVKETWSSVRSFRVSGGSSRSRSTRTQTEDIDMGHSLVTPRHQWNPLPKDGADYALENEIRYERQHTGAGDGGPPNGVDGLARGIGVKRDVVMTRSSPHPPL